MQNSVGIQNSVAHSDSSAETLDMVGCLVGNFDYFVENIDLDSVRMMGWIEQNLIDV